MISGVGTFIINFPGPVSTQRHDPSSRPGHTLSCTPYSEEPDKVVAITGASSGLGKRPHGACLDQGAKVFLGARREENLKRIADDIGDAAAYRALDVTDRDDVQSFVDAAEKQFGRVGVLLANVGLMPLSPLEAAKVDEWEQMIDVNLKGVLYGIAAVLPKFRHQRDRPPPDRTDALTTGSRHHGELDASRCREVGGANPRRGLSHVALGPVVA